MQTKKDTAKHYKLDDIVELEIMAKYHQVKALHGAYFIV